jgi:hypothetical protein
MVVIGYNLNTSMWVMVVVADYLRLMVSIMAMVKARAMKHPETDGAWCVPSVTLSFADCVVNHGQAEVAASPEEFYRVQTTLSLAL